MKGEVIAEIYPARITCECKNRQQDIGVTFISKRLNRNKMKQESLKAKCDFCGQGFDRVMK